MRNVEFRIVRPCLSVISSLGVELELGLLLHFFDHHIGHRVAPERLHRVLNTNRPDASALIEAPALLARRDAASPGSELGSTELPVTLEDGRQVGLLGGPHADRYGRTLIGQVLARDLASVSIEARFDAYGVRRLW